MSETKTSLFLWPYFALLISGLILPSDGNHGVLSPKSLAFLSTSMVIGIYLLIRRQIDGYQLRLIGFTLCALSGLLVWLLLGLLYDADVGYPFDQFKLFLITLLITVYTLYLVNEGLLTPRQILRTLIFANFAYSLTKVLLVVSHLSGIMNIFDIMEKTNIRFMSMSIIGNVGRLQTSVDIVTPFFIFFVLQSDQLNLKFSPWFKWCYCIIAIPSIFLSFSRFLLGIGLISILLHWMTLNLSRIAMGVTFCIIIVSAGVLYIGLDTVEQVIHQRFFSSSRFFSDQTRYEQIDALMNAYVETPFLGRGLGGYVKDYVRDDQLRHSYEVQWVAFLLQLGFIGLALLMIPFGIIATELIFAPFSRTRLALLALFGLWLFSGFTNPFLISLTSGIVYSSFLLCANILSKNEQFLVGKNLEKKYI